jgi:hypothetical protein
MTEITISAVVIIKDSREPEILDNSVQVIDINKIQNTNFVIKFNKKKYNFIYSKILNGYVCNEHMILYIHTKWLYVFSCNTKSSGLNELYYCYNNNGKNDKVDINDIEQLFHSSNITFYNNNNKIEHSNPKFIDICTFFGSKPTFSDLHKIFKSISISLSK